MRILTGIQPSGTLHIGNYFGAMKPALALQDADAKAVLRVSKSATRVEKVLRGEESWEAFYFIADYHSMTSLTDAKIRRHYSLQVALDWLACGLDPKKSVLWKQSDIPEVCELMWLLGTLTPMGLLERAHSYKDKTAKGISPNFGLFAYPILMAADILLFDANLVPVGKDQKQHVEMTRDIAFKFNGIYGDTFEIPEPDIRDEVATVPGLDGQKMSKSYGNTIDLFGDEKATRKKIMGIVMDSRTPAEPKPDADKNLAIQLLKLVAPADVSADLENRLRAGGMGYGDLKKALFEHYWNHFAAARARRAELANNLDYVSQVLKDGAERARVTASVVLKRARKACGLE